MSVKIRLYPVEHKDRKSKGVKLGWRVDAAGRTRGILWTTYGSAVVAYVDGDDLVIGHRLVPDGYIIDRSVGQESPYDREIFTYLDQAVFALVHPNGDIYEYANDPYGKLDLEIYQSKRTQII